MSVTAIIVDDEKDSREVLRKLLAKFCPEVNIIGEADNAESAYDLIIERKPQAVFLDIQMPGGNGFSLVKKFDRIPFEIVFTTSYDKYAIEAIKLNALHYLLKPIEVSDLTEAVLRLNSETNRQSNQVQYINLVATMENRTAEKKISIQHHDKVVLLSLTEITHFEGEGKYTIIHTDKNAKYTSSKNLAEFEEMLENYLQFMRISKSCIANLNFVTNYDKGEPSSVSICGKHRFEVSRRKKAELIELLKLKS